MNLSIKEIAGTDVSSRHPAANIRKQIIDAGALCRVDFTEVRSVSSSFADELFAVLIRDRGESWFSDNVRIAGACQEVKYVILEAISARISA